MAISERLGPEHEIELRGGTLRYRERGTGPAVVFVHGALVNGDLWRHVAPELAERGARCITPDWPLGAHRLPVPGMDLRPPALARLIGEFLESLDLREVTLVANDTGGGLTQILLAMPPEFTARIARVVLTPSDSFEYFFPPMFRYLPLLARIPGGLRGMALPLRLPAVARLPFVLGTLTRRRLPAEILESYLGPARDEAIRADAARFLRAVHRRYTLDAARRLPEFDRPVLLAWATDDRLFPISLAERLVETLPCARLSTIPDSLTFVPEDQPARLVELIEEFLVEHAALPQVGAASDQR